MTALGLLVLLLGGCSELQAAARTQRALVRAGYARPSVNVQTSMLGGQRSETVVQVRYTSRAGDDAALGAEQDRAAQIVWENAPIRLSAVAVSAITHQVGVPGLGGVQTSRGQVYSREELAGRYGPRPVDLDRMPASSVPDLVGTVLIVVVPLGVVAGVVLLAVLVVRRRRRPVPSAWPPPGQHQPWASRPQGWPAPGWGPPGPAQWEPPPPPPPPPHGGQAGQGSPSGGA